MEIHPRRIVRERERETVSIYKKNVNTISNGVCDGSLSFVYLRYYLFASRKRHNYALLGRNRNANDGSDVRFSRKKEIENIIAASRDRIFMILIVYSFLF